LDLLPAPHTGDLENAAVILVELNPGYGAMDYRDNDNLVFRDELKAQIKQDVASKEYPFLPLNPRFRETGEYEHWAKGTKFGGLIKQLAQEKFTDRRDDARIVAQRVMSKWVATIEAMPYKSYRYDKRCDELPSFQITKNFIHQYLRERARHGTLVIIIRKVGMLGFVYGQAPENFILFNPDGEAQRAYIGPKSEAGKKIIEHVCRAEGI
jgi:hypothetical protein